MEYHIAKGVFDILPQDPDPESSWRNSSHWQYVESIIRTIVQEFGFQEIRTPIFENTELFERSIGATSDIVSKEMYTFQDKGDRRLTLRPEGTAPVMRSFIEKKLHLLSPIHKLFYIIPMFRYERQQAGRYRQHHQFGVEAIGSSSFLQDAEVIDLLYSFLKRLGIKNLTLQLNSLGDAETRQNFTKAFLDYLRPFLNDLSPDSRIRFDKNPLRILDSKNPTDRKILEEAPEITDFLDPSSKEHFENLKGYLEEIGIPYSLNPQLVRGLDYYNKTVFEVTTTALGAQNALGGGGRYDGLMKELKGPDLPAFGFGAGIERIIQTMLAQEVAIPKAPRPLVFFLPLGKEAIKKCFSLLTALRRHHISAEMDFSGKKLKQTLEFADSRKIRYVVILGENELKSGKIELKNMETSSSESIDLERLEERLKND
jgi:histidyl-tRNA synthetase